MPPLVTSNSREVLSAKQTPFGTDRRILHFFSCSGVRFFISSVLRRRMIAREFYNYSYLKNDMNIQESYLVL
jgi:hypothetical protein